MTLTATYTHLQTYSAQKDNVARPDAPEERNNGGQFLTVVTLSSFIVSPINNFTYRGLQF